MAAFGNVFLSYVLSSETFSNFRLSSLICRTRTTPLKAEAISEARELKNNAKEPFIKELFHIPSNFAVCALVPMGRPKKQLTKLSRRPVEEITALETFNGAPLTK